MIHNLLNNREIERYHKYFRTINTQEKKKNKRARKRQENKKNIRTI